MAKESFSAEERAAMKERAREAKREASAAEDLEDVLAAAPQPHAEDLVRDARLLRPSGVDG